MSENHPPDDVFGRLYSVEPESPQACGMQQARAVGQTDGWRLCSARDRCLAGAHASVPRSIEGMVVREKFPQSQSESSPNRCRSHGRCHHVPEGHVADIATSCSELLRA